MMNLLGMVGVKVEYIVEGGKIFAKMCDELYEVRCTVEMFNWILDDQRKAGMLYD